MFDLSPPAQDRPLRDYQQKAIDSLRESLRAGNKRVILQQPTGAGKTRLAGELFKLARARGKRVVFTVPRIDLVDQTMESFQKDGIRDIGVMQADHWATDPDASVQIASVQTMARRVRPKGDMVIVDEAHMAFKGVHDWLAAEPETVFVGLSATPWTKGLGEHWQDLIVSTTTRELIEKGYLSPFRIFAPAHPDLKGVKTVAGDYQQNQLAVAMNKTSLVADVVETWILRGENRPTLCFGVDVAHAKHLQQRFIEAGINAGYQDAHTAKDERALIRRKFQTGEYPVVCNIGTLTTGVDWDVRCLILARPTKSEMLYVQIVGRALRMAEGKTDALILDHSDTTLRLGFPTDIHHDRLDDGRERGKQEKTVILPKECPQCAFLMAPRTKVCPNCGHEREPPLPLEHADGQLEELRPRVQTTGGRHIKLRDRIIPLPEFFAELRGYGELKGYKPGWAANKYREAVGVWPRGMDGDPIPASFEVLQWIKSRQIAFLKRRAA